jgi:hypothetical protein
MNIYNFEDPTYECLDCQEKDFRLDDIKYWVVAIVEHLYGSKELSADLLDHCMQELTHLLSFHIGNREINVKRKEPTNIQPIRDWIEFNNKYLKQL